MSIIKGLAFAAFVLAIPLFLVIMNLRVVVNTPLLYSYGFDQYEIERVTGIERNELLSAGKQIRDYFNNEERWLDVRVRIRGELLPLYNTTEILHMWDVKALIRTLYNVQLIVGLYILLFIPAGLAIAPRAFPRVLLRLVAWGAGLTLAIVFVAGLLSLTGFSQTFYVFHVIAFTNDLWQLDPARDFLIAMFPEGFFAQHRPDEVITIEDYLAARWIVKPLNLYDCDIPMCVSVAYLFTTRERAQDMKQTPVYLLTHATTKPNFGIWQTLEGAEASTDSTARKLYEGSGLTPADIDIENMYDGYTTFHNYYLESLRWHGVGKGDALHFYQGDISVEGPHPISSSGGNSGSGRTRIWMHTDSIQQLQQRAGQRQVHIKNGRPETAVSGGPMPQTGDFMIWGTSPD